MGRGHEPAAGVAACLSAALVGAGNAPAKEAGHNAAGLAARGAGVARLPRAVS